MGLEQFENIFLVKPRSRRIVARDPKLLFDRDDLAKNYAEKLNEGWFFWNQQLGKRDKLLA